MSNINKYSEGKIYVIQQIGGEGLKYYGSTTQILKYRFRGHKKDYNNWKNSNKNRKYVTSFIIFDTYGLENVEIKLLQECISKSELIKIEADYIRNKKCVNKCIPNRTPQEYKN
jgi:hypothetical protein